jgi:hypothetical protein
MVTNGLFFPVTDIEWMTRRGVVEPPMRRVGGGEGFAAGARAAEDTLTPCLKRHLLSMAGEWMERTDRPCGSIAINHLFFLSAGPQGGLIALFQTASGALFDTTGQ